MQPDSLLYLSRAIESAFEAAVYPAVIVIGAVLVAMAAHEAQSYLRRVRRARRERMLHLSRRAPSSTRGLAGRAYPGLRSVDSRLPPTPTSISLVRGAAPRER